MTDAHDDHVSDLRWDRLLAGELAKADEAAVLDHAHSCAACGARLAAITDEQRAFAQRPAFRLQRRPATIVPITRRRWQAAAAVALAAATVLLVVRLRPTDAPIERTKGRGPALILAAGNASALEPITTGDRIHPGDSLQAAYTSDRDGFGAVLSRDGSGHAMAYVPASGDAMVALPAGATRSFPARTVLDDIVGSEVVVIVWCQAPAPLAPLDRKSVV